MWTNKTAQGSQMCPFLLCCRVINIRTLGGRGHLNGKDFHFYWNGSEVKQWWVTGALTQDVLWFPLLQLLLRTVRLWKEVSKAPENMRKLWSVDPGLEKQKAEFCGISNCLVYAGLLSFSKLRKQTSWQKITFHTGKWQPRKKHPQEHQI